MDEENFKMFIPVNGQTSGCVGASSLTECFKKACIKGSTKPCYALLVANGSGGDGWRQDVLPIRMGEVISQSC